LERDANVADQTHFRETEFKELCNIIRHYSGLRYLIIPIFMAIHGAFFVALKDGILTRVDARSFSWLLYAAPVLLAAIFLILEYALSRYIDGFVAVAKKEWPNSFWGKVKRTRYLVTTSISLLYLTITAVSLVLISSAIRAVRV
jgi:hypothetical protein